MVFPEEGSIGLGCSSSLQPFRDFCHAAVDVLGEGKLAVCCSMRPTGAPCMIKVASICSVFALNNAQLALPLQAQKCSDRYIVA